MKVDTVGSSCSFTLNMEPLLKNQATTDLSCKTRIIDAAANLALPLLPPAPSADFLRRRPRLCWCLVGQIGISLMSPAEKEP